jgi:hypothetical protein
MPNIGDRIPKDQTPASSEELARLERFAARRNRFRLEERDEKFFETQRRAKPKRHAKA